MDDAVALRRSGLQGSGHGCRLQQVIQRAAPGLKNRNSCANGEGGSRLTTVVLGTRTRLACRHATGCTRKRAYRTRGLRAARSARRRAWCTRVGGPIVCGAVACTSLRGGDASNDGVARPVGTGAGAAVAADNEPPCPKGVAAIEAVGGLAPGSGPRGTAPVTSGSAYTAFAATRAGS